MARGRRAPALRTRLHGLRHMCSRRAALPRRALWVLAFCTALGLLLSWSSNRLLHWLSFPSHTQVRTEWSRQLPFPAVTLCNNNPLRFPRLSKGDLYYAGHWLGLLLPNRTARPLLTELLRGDEARLRWFAKLADFRLFLPPRHYEGISADFMDRLGHQLEDMLLSCKYRGELCGPHNFSAVSELRESPPSPLLPPPPPRGPTPAPGPAPGSPRRFFPTLAALRGRWRGPPELQSSPSSPRPLWETSRRISARRAVHCPECFPPASGPKPMLSVFKGHSGHQRWVVRSSLPPYFLIRKKKKPTQKNPHCSRPSLLLSHFPCCFQHSCISTFSISCCEAKSPQVNSGCRRKV